MLRGALAELVRRQNKHTFKRRSAARERLRFGREMNKVYQGP